MISFLMEALERFTLAPAPISDRVSRFSLLGNDQTSPTPLCWS